VKALKAIFRPGCQSPAPFTAVPTGVQLCRTDCLKFLFGLRPSLISPSEQIAPLVLAGLTAIIIGGGGHLLTNHSGDTDDMAAMALTAPVVASAADLVASAAPALTAAPTVLPQALNNLRDLAETAATINQKPEPVSRQIEVKRGHTFAQILGDADVDDTDAMAIVAAMKGTFDVRKLRPGLELTLNFTRTGDDEVFDGLSFQPDVTQQIKLVRNTAGKWEVSKIMTPLERRRIAVHMEIGGSLFEAGAKANVPRSIMAALLNIYSHEVDFQRDIQRGDKFAVMYDQPSTAEGKAVGEGTIIFAALEVGGKRKAVYRVVFSDGSAEYFNDRGQSARRTLMRTPIAAGRITSGFGMRRHPILGFSKMHKGVDFGAPIGTPIFAAGSGVVEEVGFKGAYGRYVRLRHNNKISTAYAHMSRFARDIKRGGRVEQGDVIGYVGSSGRSTGAHLHYEVMVNRQQVNPLSVNLPTGRTLDGKMLAQFKQGVQQINGEFASKLANADNGTSVTRLASNTAPTAALSAVKP
jgi:murein DD-endopeptidase MepM/ murein hydrolase activator NlpD